MKTRILIIAACMLAQLSCKNTSEEQMGNKNASSEVITDRSIDSGDETTGQLETNTASIRKMVSDGLLTEAQAEEMIANMEQLFSKENMEGFDPEKYGDSLTNVLDGMTNTLNSGENTSNSGNVSLSNSQPFLSEKDKGMANLRKMLKIDRMRYIEEVIRGWYGFSRPKRKQVARSLSSESITEEKTDEALLAFFEVSPDELEMLKTLPASETITSESESKRMRDMELSKEITDHLKSGKATESFQAVIERFNYNRGSTARRLLPQMNKAREAFYKLNPGWYGSDNESGDTYLDSHRNYIHLPLGALSFADRVVSFKTPMDNGFYPDGSIGQPDLTKEPLTGAAHPKVCNLGTRGVLTLEFTNNAITDVNGPDLFIFELGAIEPTNLEISKDGVEWIEVGKIEGGTAMVDINPFVKPNETFTYIRLTDLFTSSELPGADVDAVAAIGGALRLNLDSAVLFDTGKYQLKESASQALEKLLDDIQEIPSGTIVIEGHTDNVGDSASNKTLSENRAKEVSKYLEEHLSDQHKFVVKGFGESRPIAANDSEENKQKNRRVEILVMPSK